MFLPARNIMSTKINKPKSSSLRRPAFALHRAASR